jgi:DNA-binding MarR family transcriptional regulator
VLYSVAIQSTADTSLLATQLERRVARLTQLLRANSRTGSGVAGLLALRRLEEEGPLRITDLAAAELVAQPTMTGIVRRLEQDGLVRRTPDPLDARAARIALTDAGQAELAAVRSTRAAVLQERLDRLDDDARAALVAALEPLDQLLSP